MAAGHEQAGNRAKSGTKKVRNATQKKTAAGWEFCGAYKRRLRVAKFAKVRMKKEPVKTCYFRGYSREFFRVFSTKGGSRGRNEQRANKEKPVTKSLLF